MVKQTTSIVREMRQLKAQTAAPPDITICLPKTLNHYLYSGQVPTEMAIFLI